MLCHQPAMKLILLMSAIFMVLDVTAFAPSAPLLSTRSWSRCGVTSSWHHVALSKTAAHVTSRSVSMGFAEAVGEDKLTRRAWVGKALGVALTSALVVSQSVTPALAEAGVGEGGLPDGARQFSNLIKVQKDWAALGKTVREKGSDVSPEEWKNIALFLRKVYQFGGDLEFLAGKLSADKKKTALDLVRNIRKEVEAADVPAREQDVEGLLKAQGSVEKKFDAFMDMFNDVPSEL